MYALTGIVAANGPAYAWYHGSELAAGPPCRMLLRTARAAPQPRSTRCALIGCPSRAPTPSMPEAQARRLSSLLAKVHGWLELANSPADASTDDYFSLGLIPSTGTDVVDTAQPVHQGDSLKMALQSSSRVIEPAGSTCSILTATVRERYCSPHNYAENQFSKRCR